MKTSTTIALVVTLSGALGIAGLGRTVYAVQSSDPVAVVSGHRSNTQIAEASSGDGDGETNDDAQEQQESARLRSLAKITPQQAQASAEAAYSGRASSIKLENDDGNLVYAVVIGQKEVKVDAGNGKVLYTESLNDNANEGQRPHSSIRVSEGAGGDGDGEINDDG
jgi:uncharacterized membrane protein YkoI